MSRYSDHKSTTQILKNIEASPNNYFLIHYSCEDFINNPEGKTSRITSIAIKSIMTGQVESFSMHKTAELKNIALGEISEKYDEIEKDMLEEYFAFLEKNGNNSYYLHINMRDINYGFKAIEHRGKVLGLSPFILADCQKIDLANLLKKRFGDKYISHPRLEKLCELNNINTIGYLKGHEEAEAFVKGEYVKLHKSTLAKVEMYSNIINAAINNTLKTNAKWYDIYGLTFQGVYKFITSTWWLSLILWIISVIISFYIGEILK